MQVPRLLMVVVSLCLQAGISGCYVPGHVRHALLEISSEGSFTFQGRAVEASQLQSSISLAESPDVPLLVEIKASPSSPMDSVRLAVAAIEASHARVAFAGATAVR